MTYVIEIKGRKHRYASRDEALRVASEIFDATGIVVGITGEESAK